MALLSCFWNALNRLPIERIANEHHLFKIATYGTARDRAIMKALFEKFDPLQTVLAGLDTKFNRGFQKTASTTPVPLELIGSPKLEAVQINRFHQSVAGLPPFQYETMEHARDPKIYKAPIFLAQQSLQNDRLVGATLR